MIRVAPRRDSKVADLWVWATRQRDPWSAAEGAEGARLSARRARAAVAWLAHIGMLQRVAESEYLGRGAGRTPPLYIVPHHSVALPPPILRVKDGLIIGIRIGRKQK